MEIKWIVKHTSPVCQQVFLKFTTRVESQSSCPEVLLIFEEGRTKYLSYKIVKVEASKARGSLGIFQSESRKKKSIQGHLV